MPKIAVPLSDARVRNAKAAAAPYKIADGKGLYLFVTPAGGRLWRLDYRHNGKRKTLAIGSYPDIALADARTRRDDARKLLTAGQDPAQAKREERRQRRLDADNSFEAVANEWLAKQKKSFSLATYEKAEWTFDRLIVPYIGKRPIAAVEAPEVLDVLRRIESRGAHETAHRAKQRCGQVFRYAIATGRAKRDPTADLRGALEPVVTTGRAALTNPADIAGLLRAIASYKGHFVTACALKLAPLLFVRPGELRAAEWAEFGDLDAAEWRIPAERMKMGEAHIVPLSRQAVAILREDLQPVTGKGRFLFPSIGSPKRCMSENTITAALRRMGYSGKEMSWHGFRALASTQLNELGWPVDVIERQLAHAERNKVRAAYNRAQYLPERRKMMQAWADYLAGLASGAKVVAIGRPAA